MPKGRPMPVTPTEALQDVCDARDRLVEDGPPSLTQLAAHVELLHTLVMLLADASPNQAALLDLLRVLGRDAIRDNPAGHAIRAAAGRMAAELGR